MNTTGQKLAILVNEQRNNWLMANLFLNENFDKLPNEGKRELLERALFFQTDMLICSLFANESVESIGTVSMLKELISDNPYILKDRELYDSFDLIAATLQRKPPLVGAGNLHPEIIESFDRPMALLFFGFSILRIVERFILNNAAQQLSLDKQSEPHFRTLTFQMIAGARQCFDRARYLLQKQPNNSSLFHSLWGTGLCTYFQLKTIDFEHLSLTEPTRHNLKNVMLKTTKKQLIESWTGQMSSHWLSYFSRYSTSSLTERDLFAFFMSPYYLSCVFALSNETAECRQWMQLAKNRKQLPSEDEILKNTDFSTVKHTTWFKDFVPFAYFSEDNTEIGHYEPIPIDPHIFIPRPPKDPPASQPLTNSTSNWISTSTLNFLVGSSVIINKDNLLASSVTANNDKVSSNNQRLRERMKLYNLIERRSIPGDGNCQMYSLSDQLWGTLEYAGLVRSVVVQWLRKNGDLILPNGAKLKEFVNDKSYTVYCDEMAKEGTWGDHLTLIAAAEVFGARIFILSSVVGSEFTVEINPTKVTWPHILLMSHCAEFHYGSLAFEKTCYNL
jgi:hypothetical protein